LRRLFGLPVWVSPSTAVTVEGGLQVARVDPSEAVSVSVLAEAPATELWERGHLEISQHSQRLYHHHFYQHLRGAFALH
jgi:hypothetical protein